MSTYLIAFAVTDFRYRQNAPNASLSMRVYASPKVYDRTRFLLEKSEEAVKVYEEYLKIPYSLPKLDQTAHSLRRVGKY